MNSETKSCQNCKKDFTIESEDFNFYEKMKVPAPTWCPECRLIRRLSFQNIWNLSWRNCNKCDKKTLSLYSPEQKMTVYCQPCWWADDWDGSEYGLEYNPQKPFLEQVKELTASTPFSALTTQYTSNKNCEYANALAWCKDCYMVFWADYCDGVYYSSILNGLKSSSDCLRGWESELCYESTGFAKGYRTFFTEEFDSCVDVWFSRNCYGCTNCIGCVNLRGASYQIFNVQYTKEGYTQKLKELGFDSWENLREFEVKAREFWLTKPYREHHGNTFNLNVSGEFVYFSKNSKEGYIVNYAENCKWCQLITVATTKDCFDYSGWGNNVSQIYESITVGEKADNIKFSFECWPDVVNLEYCFWNVSGKNNFGCVNLKRKSYCILNKQYTKEKYAELKAKIIEDMKKNPYIDKLGRKFYYGEFFPSEISKFPYNKSSAMWFFPQSKEKVLAMGCSWDDTENPIHKATVKDRNLPETIKETNDSILEEIIECMTCGRGYKIVQGELGLLRKMNLPVPHECPKCRENRRFARMNKPGMYHRDCDKCKKEIYTPYAPDRPEIVYCVKCYQAEFL